MNQLCKIPYSSLLPTASKNEPVSALKHKVTTVLDSDDATAFRK
ncbi:hypothetical protein NECAME_02466, partial [Necator americanus]